MVLSDSEIRLDFRGGPSEELQFLNCGVLVSVHLPQSVR